MIGSAATAVYCLMFLIALIYAGLQLREARKARSAQLYVKLYELAARDASWDSLALCQRVKGLSYEEFRQ